MMNENPNGCFPGPQPAGLPVGCTSGDQDEDEDDLTAAACRLASGLHVWRPG